MGNIVAMPQVRHMNATIRMGEVLRAVASVIVNGAKNFPIWDKNSMTPKEVA